MIPELKAWIESEPKGRQMGAVGHICDQGGEEMEEENKPALDQLSMKGLQNMQQNMTLAATDLGLWSNKGTCSNDM